MDPCRESATERVAEPRPGGDGAKPSRRWRQVHFEVEFFDRVLARSPDYVDVLRCQGDLLNSLGQFRRALAVDERLATLQPQDCVAHYNLACSLARMGRIDDALAELRAALERGYCDFAYLQRDVDLEALRCRPGYQKLLHEFRVEG